MDALFDYVLCRQFQGCDIGLNGNPEPPEEMWDARSTE